MKMLAEFYTPPLNSRYIGHLAAYLRLRGWSAHEYARWIEFLGAPDADNAPLVLVLPRDFNSPEAENYISKAVSLLSALDDEPESLIAWRIQNVHNDVFIVRNIQTGIHSSIPIRVADQQVGELKQLISLSARAENDPRPYYYNSSSSSRVLELFRFGHTMRGSFALTVEAPILHEMELFVSSNKNQPPLLPDFADYVVSEEPITRSPIERRIVERIMRGLVAARQAANESSLDVLTNQYGSGFSGNMCDSLAQLSYNAGAIEYGVLWSPKIPVADDLQEHSSVRLDDVSYTLLRQAAAEMKRREPEEHRIRGIVTHIGSDVPPLGEGEGGRQVIIRWLRTEGQRSANIIVPLNRDQYMLASEAHLRWSTVEITGKVTRSGSTYYLVDARDLAVLN